MTRASACPPEYNVLDALSRRAHRRFVGSLIAVPLVQLSAYASQMSKISASRGGAVAEYRTLSGTLSRTRSRSCPLPSSPAGATPLFMTNDIQAWGYISVILSHS